MRLRHHRSHGKNALSTELRVQRFLYKEMAFFVGVDSVGAEILPVIPEGKERASDIHHLRTGILAYRRERLVVYFVPPIDERGAAAKPGQDVILVKAFRNLIEVPLRVHWG